MKRRNERREFDAKGWIQHKILSIKLQQKYEVMRR